MMASLAGDRIAYRRLLAAAAERLRRFFARRLGRDASAVEDLVQESLIALHRRRESYDPARRFGPWLYAIARYKLIDHLRRAGRARTTPLDESHEAVEPSHARIDLDRLLAEVPARQREAIRLTRIEGHSVAEAARLTGRSQSAIKVSVHRGLRKLRALAGRGG